MDPVSLVLLVSILLQAAVASIGNKINHIDSYSHGMAVVIGRFYLDGTEKAYQFSVPGRRCGFGGAMEPVIASRRSGIGCFDADARGCAYSSERSLSVVTVPKVHYEKVKSVMRWQRRVAMKACGTGI